MARRIVRQLVDDLDGEVVETGAGETIRFSLNGVSYELDLLQGGDADHVFEQAAVDRTGYRAGARVHCCRTFHPSPQAPFVRDLAEWAGRVKRRAEAFNDVAALLED